MSGQHRENEGPAKLAMPADAELLQRSSAVDPAAEVLRLRAVNAALTREVAALKQREAQAQRLADRDALTGLYNRRRMAELLDGAIDEAGQRQGRVGLLFIDLDGFKHINDRFGHAAGDQVLVSVSARIATRARAGDVICRYGGDEFVVVLPHVRDRFAALKVAASIGDRVAVPYRINAEQLRVTAAVGVSMFPEDGKSSAQLLERADKLMYRAKARIPGVAVDSEAHEPPARRQDDHSTRPSSVTDLWESRRLSRHG